MFALNPARLLLLVFCVAFSFESFTSNQSFAEEKPNIVFILADDLGYREIGSFGQQLIKTPNLGAFAKQSMRLTQHYCGNAVCAPSRRVLKTGKHTGHAFVRDNKSTKPEGQQPIPKDEVTIGELLQA